MKTLIRSQVLNNFFLHKGKITSNAEACHLSDQACLLGDFEARKDPPHEDRARGQI